MQAETQTVQEKIALRRGVEAQIGPIATVLAPSRSFVAHRAAAMRPQVVAIDQSHCRRAQGRQETCVAEIHDCGFCKTCLLGIALCTFLDSYRIM
jgi:hypothetical protein